ncbi:MAG: low molecular weight protein arginine phosphatase [Anaerolineae bacterium]|nr:low molecular weight protein arginine phosphatase [Anaerolineae bacterium]
MKIILFVCTGNLCRSPMAAGLMRRRLAAVGLDGQVQVRSAGIFAIPGRPASASAVQVMAERGVDISQHRSKTLELQDLEQADIVLVMEEAHRRSIFNWAPHLLRKVFLLSEMVGEHYDVTDPYMGTVEEYRRRADEIEALLDAGFDSILKYAGISLPKA